MMMMRRRRRMLRKTVVASSARQRSAGSDSRRSWAAARRVWTAERRRTERRTRWRRSTETSRRRGTEHEIASPTASPPTHSRHRLHLATTPSLFTHKHWLYVELLHFNDQVVNLLCPGVSHMNSSPLTSIACVPRFLCCTSMMIYYAKNAAKYKKENTSNRGIN